MTDEDIKLLDAEVSGDRRLIPEQWSKSRQDCSNRIFLDDFILLSYPYQM